MSSFNKVILMGNLTRDPEVRHTQGGMAVCSASLAVNEKFKDSGGEWQDRSTFIDVTIWGKRGEAFAKYHSKGSSAFLEGKLRLDQWEDKDTGAKRSKLFVVADSWEFVSGKSEERAPATSGDSWGGPGGSSTPLDDTPF